MTTIRALDVIQVPHGSTQCAARGNHPNDPAITIQCGREDAHEGQHAALSPSGRVIAAWGNQDRKGAATVAFTDRFSQKDTNTYPYGVCMTCTPDLALKTEGEARNHMREQGHGVRVLNPTRADRIESEVNFELDGELDSVFESLYELIERGDATADEITRAIGMAHSIEDQWADYLREMAE